MIDHNATVWYIVVAAAARQLGSCGCMRSGNHWRREVNGAGGGAFMTIEYYAYLSVVCYMIFFDPANII